MALLRSSLALPLLALLAACGGRTLDPIADAPDTGIVTMRSINQSDGGIDTGLTNGLTCVDVTVSAGDLACEHDSDCTQTNSGRVCADTCPCGGTAVNNAAASRIATDVQGLENGECECPAFGTPTCVNRACTLCGGFMQPAGCAAVDCTFNASACGSGSPDTGIVDGGEPDSAGSASADGDPGAPISTDSGTDPTPRTGLGTIGCGPNLCNADTEFCYSSCGGDPLNSLSCLSIPSGCLNAADPCACYIDLVNPGDDRPDADCLCTVLAILTDGGNCNEFLRYCSQ